MKQFRCKFISLILLVIILISSVSAIDVQVWQGKYLTGSANTVYTFNFTVYDDILVGTPCWSSEVDLTTNSDRWWYTEQEGVLASCNNPLENYYLRLLKQLKYADLSLDNIFSQNVNVVGNMTLVGTLYGSSPLEVGDSLNVTGNVTAPYFIGDGSQLTGLIASQIVGGALNSSQIDDIYLFNTGDNASGNYNFDSNTLVINSTTHRVGIGTNNPQSTLDVVGNFAVNENDFFVDSSTGRVGIGTNNPDPSIKLHVIGQIRASSFRPADGTVGLPSYRFESDADVGMYLPASNNLGFTIDGIERLRINEYGNIGIGTTNPNSKLDVAGSVNLNNSLYVNSSSGNIGIGTESPSRPLDVLGGIKANSLEIEEILAHPGSPGIGILDDGSNFGIFIEDGGNVGIRRDNPEYQLDVNGTFRVGGDYFTEVITADSDTGEVMLGIDGYAMLEIYSGQQVFAFMNGDVGIGTYYPTQILDVKGNINVSGYYYGDGSQLTGISGEGGGGWTNTSTETTTLLDVGIGNNNPSQELDVTGDVEIGGGASDYDGTDEFIHINSQNQDWYIGVRNLVTDSGNDFHIGLTQAQDGIFHIQPDGKIGIGTTAPTHKLSVVGDINVTGNLILGYEIIQTICYDGSSCSAVCPTGKKVIGGGCGNSEYITITQNYPNAENEWDCGISSTASVVEAYAICARID